MLARSPRSRTPALRRTAIRHLPGTVLPALLAVLAAAALAGPGAPGASAATARPGRPARPVTSIRRVSAAASAAPATFNPVTGSNGFSVFARGNAALNATSTAGPVALGGNLTVGSSTFTVASSTAGSFTASGDSRPTALLVGGRLVWTGAGSSGLLTVQNSGYVKVGDTTATTVAQFTGSATHLVPSGNTYFQLPQIAQTVTQGSGSISQSGLIDFTSAFSTFSSESADMASCANTLVLTDANGTPLTFPLPPGTNAFVTLTPGVQNILNISAANLANIAILNFRNSPSASTPLIINVNTGASGSTFSWTSPNFNGLPGSGSAAILWNFPTAGTVTIGGSRQVPGTIYAPGAMVNENDSSGLNGGVISSAYAQGGAGGSPSGGQVLSSPFSATITSCTIQQLSIGLTSDVSTVVPGGTVRYTVTVLNSGSVAYTGATFTNSLTGVLDDATYNNNATTTAGAVSFTSPNLTWIGNLAAGASATTTYTVTVKNPDTGNQVLANSVTSATAGNNCPSGGTDPSCSNTVTVTSGTLTMTAPASASLGSAAPGGLISASLGNVQVVDNRGLGAGWTATVSTTAFTTGGKTAAETIQPGRATYKITGLTATTGTATFITVPSTTLALTPQPVVTATSVGSNNSATWNPLIQIQVPAQAVGGRYTATITHSVS